MKISDIANRKFSQAFMGYNISEVDEFLDEIAKDIERREQDIKLLELRNEMLIERLAANGVSLAADKAENTEKADKAEKTEKTDKVE